MINYIVTSKGRVPLNEAKEETLDELSKKTLGRYVKRASTDAAVAGVGIGSKNDNDSTKRLTKRIMGIHKATDKLTKEEVEELDEATVSPEFTAAMNACKAKLKELNLSSVKPTSGKISMPATKSIAIPKELKALFSELKMGADASVNTVEHNGKTVGVANIIVRYDYTHVSGGGNGDTLRLVWNSLDREWRG